jgi:class 3 adenylate cyclase/tetratricopeptide (TPR) repeat protein
MIACPTCSFELTDDSAFCSKCGTRLAASPPQPEERKVVTTLFCDLVAFTAMSEAADPEDIDAVLRAYHAAARKVIESHGGTVEKFIGDAVVGVFGVPTVHEDDPERAVRAGLRIVEALEGASRPDGSPLQARVGVNTGEALVRLDVDPASGRGFLTGDAVNTGGVAVGALAHELAQRTIDFERLAPVVAKGKAEPVAAWRALATRARRGIDVRSGQLTPLVGREIEVAYLSAIFEKTASRAPQFALIVGEPGIGKSRLVAEIFAYVDARPEMTTWRQGYCPPFGESITYWALAEVVKGHAGILDSDDVPAVEAKLESVLPEDSDRDWFRQRLRALLGLPAPEAPREENFAAWLRFFEHVAGDRPTVLVFEDLHWADEAMLAFLEYLSTRLASVPLLVVGTARPELFERRPDFATGGRVNRLEVGPLSATETVRLVGSLMGGPVDHASAIDRVVERCDGNPFYAEQSVRLLSDLDAGAALPESVQAVIAARLDTLPVEEKALLADAAVVGSVFWDGVLGAMGERDSREVDARLSGLLDRQLIRRIRNSSMEGEREFAFVHALAREVAYRQLPRAVRARRHSAVAHWLEAKVEGHPEDIAEVLAHHFATAFELARAAGEDELATQLQRPSVRYLTVAGDRALNLDLRAAERFYTAALDLSVADGPERAYLDLKLGVAALWGGRSAEAADPLQRAVEALRSGGDVRSAAVALARLARTRHNLGADAEAVEGLYREAVALLDDDGPSDARVTVLTEWGRELSNSGRSIPALAALERALEAARECGAPEPPLALGLRGAVRAGLGDPGFIDDYRRALDLAEAQDLGSDRARIWGNYANDIDFIEGPQRSLKEHALVIDFAISRGLVEHAAFQRVSRVITLVFAGEWDEARREMTAVEREFAQSAGNASDLLMVRVIGSLPLAWRGADVHPGLAEALAEARRSPWTWEACWVLTSTAIATAHQDLEEAHRLLREMVSTVSSGADAYLFHVAPEAVRVALRCRDPELAGCIRGLLPGEVPGVQIALASVASQLAEAGAEYETAAGGFSCVAGRWHDFGVPYEEAQALLGQARCLVALRRAPEASAPLNAAREIFIRLGATPALAEIDLLLSESTPAPH